jgi:hypothetical protein
VGVEVGVFEGVQVGVVVAVGVGVLVTVGVKVGVQVLPGKPQTVGVDVGVGVERKMVPLARMYTRPWVPSEAV